jgi:hypothetical protein
LNAFETCAWRYYQISVIKEVTEKQSPQMAEGNRVHKALENRIKDRTPLPDDLKIHERIVIRMEKAAEGGNIVAEQKMALDENFQPVSYFSKNPPVWVRGITDVTIERGDKAAVFDWKTGKRDPVTAQLRLTAAMTFAHRPHINEIRNAFLWLKTGEVDPETFHRKDVASLWQEFLPRVARLEAAHATDRWPKKPSGLCRDYCPVPHSKCEHRG